MFILASEKAKETIKCDLSIPYGTREGEKFDIFGADTLPKGNLKYHYQYCDLRMDRTLELFQMPQYLFTYMVAIGRRWIATFLPTQLYLSLKLAILL